MIQTLTITHFRNHSASRIRTGGCANIIITGPNGGGKTSILEAISILSGNGGLRGATPAEMARDGAAAATGVNVEMADGAEIAVSFSAGEPKKKAKINNDAAPLSKLGQVMRMVWVTPREDRVFIDAASDRRAFFDRLASGFISNHAGHVFRLSKLLSERAFALKSGASDIWLLPLERQISEIATRVAHDRAHFIRGINRFLADVNTAATLTGMLEEKIAGGADVPDLTVEYADYLSKNRVLVADKSSIDGPHRADFGLFDGNLGRRAEQISTGQQKAALLRLIIAYAKLVRENSSAPVIVLLDEIAAHLDTHARQVLFLELQAAGAQVWMTGLDAASFSDVPNAKFIYCENGAIQLN